MRLRWESPEKESIGKEHGDSRLQGLGKNWSN